MGVMDPEVRFTAQGQEVMSDFCKDGGKTPKWNPNTRYEIEIMDKGLEEDIMKLEICNYKNVSKPRVLGYMYTKVNLLAPEAMR